MACLTNSLKLLKSAAVVDCIAKATLPHTTVTHAKMASGKLIVINFAKHAATTSAKKAVNEDTPTCPTTAEVKRKMKNSSSKSMSN